MLLLVDDVLEEEEEEEMVTTVATITIVAVAMMVQMAVVPHESERWRLRNGEHVINKTAKKNNHQSAMILFWNKARCRMVLVLV
jgi:hypothetical protein